MIGRLSSGVIALFACLKKYGFYALAAIQALLLIGLFIQFSATPQSGSDNGGGEMGLFFFILFPFLVLSITVLIYRFVTINFVRILAAGILILQLVSMMALFLRDGLPVAG
jgi:hypothetical protein